MDAAETFIEVITWRNSADVSWADLGVPNLGSNAFFFFPKKLMSAAIDALWMPKGLALIASQTLTSRPGPQHCEIESA